MDALTFYVGYRCSDQERLRECQSQENQASEDAGQERREEGVECCFE